MRQMQNDSQMCFFSFKNSIPRTGLEHCPKTSLDHATDLPSELLASKTIRFTFQAIRS